MRGRESSAASPSPAQTPPSSAASVGRVASAIAGEDRDADGTRQHRGHAWRHRGATWTPSGRSSGSTSACANRLRGSLKIKKAIPSAADREGEQRRSAARACQSRAHEPGHAEREANRDHEQRPGTERMHGHIRSSGSRDQTIASTRLPVQPDRLALGALALEAAALRDSLRRLRSQDECAARDVRRLASSNVSQSSVTARVIKPRPRPDSCAR